jgi:hypothetical protein
MNKDKRLKMQNEQMPGHVLEINWLVIFIATATTPLLTVTVTLFFSSFTKDTFPLALLSKETTNI